MSAVSNIPLTTQSSTTASQARQFTAISHEEWTQKLGYGALHIPTQMVHDAYERYRTRPIPNDAEDPFRPPSLQPRSCQGLPWNNRPIASNTGQFQFLNGTVNTMDVYPVVTLDDGTKARNPNYHEIRVITGSMYVPQGWFKTAKTTSFTAIQPAAGVPRYPGDQLLVFDIPLSNKVKTDSATRPQNQGSNSATAMVTDCYFPLEDTCEEIYKAFSEACTARDSRAKEEAKSARTGGSIRLPE